MKPFLILQLRPEPEASQNEFEAILAKSGLAETDVYRIQLDQQELPADLSLDDYAGVIVGGGPGCVSDNPEKKTDVEARIEAAILGLMPEITARDYPFLGCCYGIGVLGHHLGKLVSKENYSESPGAADCSLTEEGKVDPMLSGMPDSFRAFVGHKEALQRLPEGCAHLVSSPTCPFQMVRYGQNVYATQFHPEADANGFEFRINLYRHHGYFAPEEADALIEMCHASDVHAPEHILRNFVQIYGKSA